MKKYLRSNVVMAEPMNLGVYNAYRGWKLPENETGKEEGYHLVYADGYESWCPKAEFEKVSREINYMTFGQAIEAAKVGHRITRKGWNGKGMFVVYQKGYPQGIPCNAQTAKAYGYKEGDLFKCRPYLQMRCADGSHQMWLASQSDILEEDWGIVE